jgi:hypothetical protein
LTDRPTIPPSALPRAIRLETPKVGRPITTLILGPCWGALVHHRGKTQAPLLCQGEACPKGACKAPTNWKGYWPAEIWLMDMQEWIPCVLETTSNAAHLLAQRNVRGEVWEWRKDGADKTSPMTGRLIERFGEHECGPVFDVSPIIMRFYRVMTLPESVANPVPPKQLVVPRTGRAPATNVCPESLAPPQPATPEEVEKVRQRFREELQRKGWRAPR